MTAEKQNSYVHLFIHLYLAEVEPIEKTPFKFYIHSVKELLALSGTSETLKFILLFIFSSIKDVLRKINLFLHDTVNPRLQHPRELTSLCMTC